MTGPETTRRPFIAGNWKMYKTGAEAAAYIARLKELLPAPLLVDVAVAPTFTALSSALAAAAGTPIRIAAQNVFWEKAGAFTGEVSVPMLEDLGVTWVILGHSERRQYFGETDETVNRRLRAVLAGRMSEAEEWLEQILDEFPDDPEASNDLGFLWADRNQYLHRALRMLVRGEPQDCPSVLGELIAAHESTLRAAAEADYQIARAALDKALGRGWKETQ
jgi:hypothetical protein